MNLGSIQSPVAMKIFIASLNIPKVSAVKELIVEYPMLAQADVQAVQALSGISDQPKSLEETIRGAINRAKYSIVDADYSFCIESGLM